MPPMGIPYRHGDASYLGKGSHLLSSTNGTLQAWGGGGNTPVSLVNVTCIPRQYLVLGSL